MIVCQGCKHVYLDYHPGTEGEKEFLRVFMNEQESKAFLCSFDCYVHLEMERLFQKKHPLPMQPEEEVEARRVFNEKNYEDVLQYMSELPGVQAFMLRCNNKQTRPEPLDDWTEL